MLVSSTPRVARLLSACALLIVMLATTAPAAAVAPGNDAFERTWARTDKPVANGEVARTWMWGPEANTPLLPEDYAEGPGGQRLVQYFDKSRMEITSDPNVPRDSPWYVTNGLLVKELVTGQMQVGASAFLPRQPANVNVAGDVNDPDGPTYATFAGLLDEPALPDGVPIVQRLSRDGTVTTDPLLAGRGVTAASRVSVPGIDHQVASPFWAFMNAEGMVFENGVTQNARLFLNPFYATGYPIAEAYWATVRVAGVAQDVLIQCFERRCLTYTPGNAPQWQVEAGNVGAHYYAWRYSAPPLPPGQAPADGATLYQSSLADWAPVESPFGSGFAQDGAYRLRNTSGYSDYLWLWSGGATTPNAYGDSSASVEVRMVSDSVEAYGCLLAKASAGAESADLNEAYTFCVDGYGGGDTGTVSVFYETWDADGAYGFEVLLDFVTPSALRPKNEWNTLKLVTRGNQLWFLLNGQLIGTATFDGPASGEAGIAVINADIGGTAHSIPAEFEFRNLVVRSVS